MTKEADRFLEKIGEPKNDREHAINSILFHFKDGAKTIDSLTELTELTENQTNYLISVINTTTRYRVKLQRRRKNPQRIDW